MSLVIPDVEVCLDTGNAGLSYLKLRDLHGARQLRIIQSSAAADGRSKYARYPNVPLLYRLQLRKLDTRSVQLNLVALALRVEQEVCFDRACGRAHLKGRIHFFAIALELKRELLQGLTVDFGLYQPYRTASRRVQLRSAY